MQKVFPWQQKEWQYLLARKKINKLPHAILISGMEGIGKNLFAKNFAELLLCQNASDNSEVCSSCNSCELYRADNHPDFFVLKPEDKSKAIKVDQVRELIAELNNTAHFDGHRVVIIGPADLLNIAASNALLKTLEEPAEKVVIILVSAHPTALPATIRSRCQNMLMHPPKYFMAKEWLEKQLPEEDAGLLLSLAENAPLKALELASEGELSGRQEFFHDLYNLEQGKVGLVEVVKRNLSLGLSDLLTMFIYLTSDLVKIKLGSTRSIVNQDQLAKLKSLAAKTTLEKLLAYKESLYELRRHLVRKINLNQQMAVENLLITYGGLFDG